MKYATQFAAILIMAGLALSACGPTSGSGESPADPAEETDSPTEDEMPAASESTLTGVDWELSSYTDASGSMTAILAESRVTARFEEGMVNGTAGCNRYFGAAVIDSETLAIGPLGSTMMACPEPLMAQEQAFLTNLEQSKSYEFEGQGRQLVLKSDQGQELLRFDLVEPVELAGSSWQVVSYNNGRGAVVSVLAESEGQLTAEFGTDGQLSGSGGCNSYSAAYEHAEGTLRIGAIAATEKFCEQPEGLMAQEAEFLAALSMAATYRIDGPQMEIRSTDGALLVSLVTQ